MGYSIWDRVEGGPAKLTRYVSKRKAERACKSMNDAAGSARYFVKAL